MKDLIIIGGFAPDNLHIDSRSYRRIIAADSGYDTAIRLGLKPDAVIGDFDSTSRKSELIEHGYSPCPEDKDETDAELAIMHSQSYDLIGGGEGRLDHTLSLFTVFRRYESPCIWYMRTDTVVSMKGVLCIEGNKGMHLSMFPLTEASVFTSGLKWNLNGEHLSSLFISLSNRLEEDKAMVRSAETIFIRFSPEDFENVRISIPDTTLR